MNITFKPNGFKEWTITDDKIIYKGKEVPLSSLILVSHRYPIETSANGVIQVYFGKGFSENFTLAYPVTDKEKGQEVAKFLLNLVSNERFIDERTEPNSPKLSLVQRKSAVPLRALIWLISLFAIGALIVYLFVGGFGKSKNPSNPNNNDGYYDKYDYDNDGNINQQEWEDALGDYMDNLEN